MRNPVFKSLLYIGLLVSLHACDKESVEREKEPTRNEDTGIKINLEQEILYLDDTDIIEISTIDTFEYYDEKFPVYEVAIEGSVDEVESIIPGSIVYFPSGKEGGKLIFVTEVEGIQKGTYQYKGVGAVIVKGLQTSLDQYLNGEHSVLEFSTPENRAKKNSKLKNKLQSPESFPLGDEEMGDFEFDIAGLTFASTPEQLCKISLDATLWEKDDSYVKVDGFLGVHPAIDFFVEYEPEEVREGSSRKKEFMEWMEAAAVPDLAQALYRDQNFYMGNMKELRCNLYTAVDRELNFHVKLKETFDKPVRIPLGAIPVPTVPVSASIELAFEINFEILGEVEMEIYSKKEEDINMSVVFDRDMAKPEWVIEYSDTTESGFEVQAKLELTAGISLVLSTEVYIMGIFGPEFNAGPYISANAAFHSSILHGGQTALDWRLSAIAGLKCDATLNLAAFHMDKATWKIWEIGELKSTPKEIYLAPSRLDIESGNLQEGSLGTELTNPIRIAAYDSRDKLITYLPVPVYFETDFGSVNPAMDWTDEGIAETAWTLGDQNSDQTLIAYFNNGTSKAGEIEINATTEENTSITAEFVADITSVEEGGIVHFTDQSSGSPTSWSWDFGDNGISTEQHPSHTYSEVGTYTVELQVSNAYDIHSEVKAGYITVSENGGINESGSLADSRDGNAYRTVKIGDQWWMAENLKYLPEVSPSSLASGVDPHYYVYDYDGSSVNTAMETDEYDTYGTLYNWTASQDACPDGWHLPSDADFMELEMSLGMSEEEASRDEAWDRGTIEGGLLKDEGTLFWQSPNTGGNNASGFTALPAGVREVHGTFIGQETLTVFWTTETYGSTRARHRSLQHDRSTIRENDGYKENGHSVRCVKD